MPQHLQLQLHDEVERKLCEIPTATTLAERNLALFYTAQHWDGQSNVFENGPLLGGSTRALAMGMAYNDLLAEGVGLYTYDWFSLAQPLDLPDGTFELLVTAGLLTEEEVATANDEGSFLSIFQSLHRNEEYAPLLHPGVGYLPGHPGETKGPDGTALFEAPDREFNLAFIDGCKSWYGTKYWFRELVSHLQPDTDIMFQDFGHYTCFWISSLIGLMRERFQLRAHVDHTYVWRLLNPPTADEVETTVPDEPTGVPQETYTEIYARLMSEAAERGDRWGTMIHQAHRAAAYAYTGEKEKAAKILDHLLMQAEWLPVRPYLKEARLSPTYTPEGRIEL